MMKIAVFVAVFGLALAGVPRHKGKLHLFDAFLQKLVLINGKIRDSTRPEETISLSCHNKLQLSLCLVWTHD